MPNVPPRIPRPPSKDELDQISREQAMIADEWAPQPAAPSNKSPKATDSGPN
jgi:hypothetical protein